MDRGGKAENGSTRALRVQGFIFQGKLSRSRIKMGIYEGSVSKISAFSQNV